MTVSAGLGIANFPFEDAKGFWRWVDLCDKGGVDSIWQSDRLIGPDPNLECMSVMAALAGATRNLKFGMNVASLGLRDPVLTAKACATIDVLSEGRLLPAFGVGSARSRDYAATGTPTRGRGKRSEEGLQILSRLWCEDSVTMEGQYYQLKDASIAPKPVQQPLPLWVGGSAPQAIERTAQWGTGWQAGIESPDEVQPVIAAIKARAAELGRPIDEDHYGAGFAFRFGQVEEPIVTRYHEFLTQRLGKPADGFLAVGDVEDIMALLQRFRDAGVHKFILRPIAQGTEDFIDQTRLLIERVLPEVAALNEA
ncbi:MAG: LLM class flavin-dependent oxidoreductase [Gammaproteobacteria bacterium]|nr:LLM class flavin-dependent oxidoreductase [Gammaproteobacteria bacterium]MYK81445.1 LLM class flavin-dependent oxidoreductase [Gammaproteobacteria bacterium]